MRKPLKGWQRDEKRFQTAMILPIFTAFKFLGIAPFVIMIFVSFTNWSPRLTADWSLASFLGGLNYIEFPRDLIFLGAVSRTLLLVAGSVGLEFLIGFWLAYFFREEFFGKRNLVTLLIIPLMTAPVVNGHMWFLFLQPDGPLNAILSSLMGTWLEIPWLSIPNLALVSIAIADIWQWTPFVFLVLLAGMMALPQDPIDAARVLGASEMQILRYIKVPLLKPLIVIVLLLRSIEAFKLFDTVWIMTGGGPGYSTQTITMYIYEEAFRHAKIGYNGAISVAVWLIMLLITYYFIKRARLI